MILFFGVLLLFGCLLYGMYLVKKSFTPSITNQFITLMAYITNVPWKAFLFGMLIGLLLTNGIVPIMVLAVLVATRILTYYQSIGIIFGINLGTALALYVITYGYELYVAPLALIGALLCYGKNKQKASTGFLLIGVAIMLGALFGIERIGLFLITTGGFSLHTETILVMNMVLSLLSFLAVIGMNKEAHYPIQTYVLLNVVGIIICFPTIYLFKGSIELEVINLLCILTITCLAIPIFYLFNRFKKKYS